MRSDRNRVLLSSLFILILTAANSFIPSGTHAYSGQSMSQLYRYRKTILINYTSAGANLNYDFGNTTLLDYQVLIRLDGTVFPFEKCMSQGQDIRFTDDDAITPLDYWIETWDAPQQYAAIWVKVPQMVRYVEKTIYLFYGRPGDVGASDGKATFEFFDDFSGGLSNWIIGNGTAIENGHVKLTKSAYARINRIFEQGDYAVFIKMQGLGQILLCYIDSATEMGFGYAAASESPLVLYRLSNSGMESEGSAGGFDPSSTIILQNGRDNNLESNTGISMYADFSPRAAIVSSTLTIDNYFIKLLCLSGTCYTWYVAIRKYSGWDEAFSINIDSRELRLSGDANQDGTVDVLDLVKVAIAFGSNPNLANWNSACDFNEDNSVDILDLALVGATFGKVI